eukprot:CAMPEP_0177554540 /NCGR_PEP_ID=MMETSP0369-20130122/68027_1 /TAXON_ID=447022 ORGANISM="Scrippsiella hangoei-like, Strain SHHI-4" /NCGR_SAMPLE_ID=MMETSP0369 /ASSEMBLY_ACC=CAM_ASM_000364 /LENGTH=75 /DNA_ID=CAMNT_0019040549 /DNA_START=9 /DNA_END=233 /DNA_ORIENTATION=+
MGPTPPHDCVAAFDSQSDELFAISGGKLRASHIGSDEAFENQFNQAEQHLQACWDLGGRFWELRLRAADLARAWD